MTYVRRTLAIVVGLGVLSCLVACGGFMSKVKDAAQEGVELATLYQSYKAFHDEKKKGPADADEWLKWAEGQPDKSAVALIEETKPGKKYKFYWGVNFDKLPASKDKVILGHSTKLPGAEGTVITCDGNAQYVQPAQFNGMTKPN